MIKSICLAAVGCLYVVALQAQGCSDAGFCSIGNLKAGAHPATQPNQQYLRFEGPIGLGDENVFVFSPGIEYGLRRKGWVLSGKLTGNFASGNLGSKAGLGDLFLSWTGTVWKKAGSSLSATLATKLPLSSSNLKLDGLPLPMQYQSSLGTVDLITGIAFSRPKWSLAAGLQQPLTGSNSNGFLPEFWGQNEANAYPASRRLKRAGDILLRASYRVLNNEAWNIDAGLLGIYHLKNDSYQTTGPVQSRIDLEGSRGLTLNITAAVNYRLSSNWTLSVLAGTPAVVRDIRPDGLTRSFVLSPQITYSF
jgi:hypothetical protein